MDKHKWNRIVFSLLGVMLIGIAIGLARVADLGTDPFSTFNLGTGRMTGLSFGTYMLLVNVVGLVLVFMYGRQLLGLGTVLSIVLVGYVSDYTLVTIGGQFGTAFSMGVRILLGLMGILVLAIGAAMYISADQGVAPYDALPVIIEERSNGRISFSRARIISDIACIAIGFLFGATVGIITIVSAFLMGPLIQKLRNTFTAILLESENMALKKESETGGI